LRTKILIIEDEQDLVFLLHQKLEGEGYEVVSARDGVYGIEIVQQQRPDLVLLDIMMPRMNGWEACRRIRELSDVPIIMLTALGGEVNTARGLEMGADDYVTKPFSLVELSARVRAALRRYKYPLSWNGVARIDERLTLDRETYRLRVDGKELDLSPIEFKILDCFLRNVGRILTHQSLLTQVWGWEYAEETDYLKVYIHHLRKKIEKDPRHPRYILTERGLGYRFQIP
jgi:two-component system KDP operon response regulator KdpE